MRLSHRSLRPGTIRLSRILSPLFVLVLIGCNKTSDNTASAPPSRTHGSPASAPAGYGVIHGKVVFAGTPPPPRPIDNSHCHSGHPRSITEEAIVVNPNGTLRNVVVYVKDVPGQFTVPADVPVVDQVDCQYVPHVTAVLAGQAVAFHSSDPCLHNVHVAGVTASTNKSVLKGGQVVQSFPDPEFVPVKCDVHPWMRCYIAVMDNPCFAVTSETGEFTIPHVPAGRYTIATQHERLEPLTQEVTIQPDQTVEITFTVQAP